MPSTRKSARQGLSCQGLTLQQDGICDVGTPSDVVKYQGDRKAGRECHSEEVTLELRPE